ncbi:MAG: accessory gene regulator B family protein [Oscillospiraceae bacterium]|nr:accessory gene regulator B family protein [Oscillospiraceae bacterium]
MISFLSDFIALFLYKKKIIDEERLPVCKYGFEIIVSTIIGFLLVLTSGIILGEFMEAVLFYCLFVGVRLFTGGYHANTHLKCKMTLLICCLFVLVTSKYLKLSIGLQCLLLLLYLIAVFLFSPVEHINAPLTTDQKTRNRKISIIMAIALTIISLLGHSYFSKTSFVSSLTLFVIAILIIIPKIQERRKMLYEKSNRKNS